MGNKAIGNYLLLEPDELPTVLALKDAIYRLNKDAELLKRLPKAKDGDPQNLMRTADFLQHLINTYKRQFPKGDRDNDTSDNSGS